LFSLEFHFFSNELVIVFNFLVDELCVFSNDFDGFFELLGNIFSHPIELSYEDSLHGLRETFPCGSFFFLLSFDKDDSIDLFVFTPTHSSHEFLVDELLMIEVIFTYVRVHNFAVHDILIELRN